MAEVSRLPPPLERPEATFSGRAVDVLRDMVLTGKLRSGERINEVELATALGISRGPLREAIQRLRSDGLLTGVSGRGAFVRTFTRRSLSELYEVRIALEAHAIRLIADRPDPADGITQLRSMLEQTDQTVAKESVYPSDLDFHQRLILLTDNQALITTSTDVLRQIHLARSRSGHVTERAHQALNEHFRILDMMTVGDTAGAVSLLVEHLHGSLQNALQVFEAEGAGNA